MRCFNFIPELSRAYYQHNASTYIMKRCDEFVCMQTHNIVGVAYKFLVSEHAKPAGVFRQNVSNTLGIGDMIYYLLFLHVLFIPKPNNQNL